MQVGQLTEGEVEQEIQNKGLNAPRISPQDIDALIFGEHFWVAPLTTTTVCVLVLRNGFTVVGESSCASPENFDIMIGRKIARDNARSKIWALEGYLLRQKIFEGGDDVYFDDRRSVSV